MANEQDGPRTIIGTAFAELLALVPPRHRARAIELALILHGEYAAGEAAAHRDGHNDGFQAGHKAAEEAGSDGYRDGWNSGRDAAIRDVMGRISAPARERTEDGGDPLTKPPDLLPS